MKKEKKKKTYRFLYIMKLDIKAENISKAKDIFAEMNLSVQKKSCFRDTYDIFEVDKNCVRKEEKI